jgi:CTP:molybdopterin cytidylyltransferase MocA
MGAPKALLELAGVPLVRAHVERALELGYPHALVIVRPELAERVRQLFAPLPYADRVRIVSAATCSQAASLALLVRLLAADGPSASNTTVLITPVDALPCSDATHRELSAALTGAVLAVTPQFEARGGHPVLLKAEMLETYLHGSLESCCSLRDLLAEAGERRRRIDVADQAVVSDVDTPEEARALGLRTVTMDLAPRAGSGST